jgi:hypothetical protein
LHKSSLFESQIKNVQAQARGVLARRALEDKRIMYEDAEEWITSVRSISMLPTALLHTTYALLICIHLLVPSCHPRFPHALQIPRQAGLL